MKFNAKTRRRKDAVAIKNQKLKSISLCVSASLRLCVKNLLLVFTFIILFSLGAFAQSDSTQSNETLVMPADFESDGCSLFPDFDYRDCCVEHDKLYYYGGSWTKRWRADKKLFKCVAAKKGVQHKFLAPLMWVGVRAFGVPWLPTPFRWGFGKNKKKVNNSSPPENKKVNNKSSKNSNRKKTETLMIGY